MSEKLLEAIVAMEEGEALEVARSLLDGGEDPIKVLGTCTRAMEAVGKRFEAGTYFLPELMMAGEILSQISAVVKPKLKGEVVVKKHGRVLMGTVQGDIHNIGKDIVTFLLDVNGFEVKDIGIDVPPETFVEAIGEFKPQVVGMSGLLTVAYESMKNTVEAIEDAGLRDGLKIVIGGGLINDSVCRYVGADAFAKDAVDGVGLAKKWVELV
jgi:trimethylamine corrinoid protein